MKDKIDELRDRLSGIPGLTKLSESEAHQLRVEFAGIPKEYTDFLTRIGHGNLGELQLYEGPIPASDVYPQLQNSPQYVLFCDDFQGYCYGFDTQNFFSIVEMNPRGMVNTSGHNNFSDLIKSFS
jgi:hypothetical protein